MTEQKPQIKVIEYSRSFNYDSKEALESVIRLAMANDFTIRGAISEEGTLLEKGWAEDAKIMEAGRSVEAGTIGAFSYSAGRPSWNGGGYIETYSVDGRLVLPQIENFSRVTERRIRVSSRLLPILIRQENSDRTNYLCTGNNVTSILDKLEEKNIRWQGYILAFGGKYSNGFEMFPSTNTPLDLALKELASQTQQSQRRSKT
ncbi:MAG: hypothetical protein AABY16_02855 [Nanoarchaeota archaeon]